MPWAKWDIPTELADTAQDLRENCEFLEDRFDTSGCLERKKSPTWMQCAKVFIKPKAIPIASLDIWPQSHEATERLENEDLNIRIHQLQLTMAFPTSGPITASD